MSPDIRGPGPVTESTTPDDSRRTLGRRQQSVAEQLRALDPSLEGLYLQGLALSIQTSTPGVPYLLAHAGRELSRGVIRQLSGGKLDPLNSEQAKQETADTERNRISIAAALGVGPHDAVVNDWFRAVGVFSDNCHYQNNPAAPDEISTAFALLDRFLFAVLAPYFDATPEVDRLLAVAVPTSNDIASLKGILARRALRVRFFNSVSNPAWVTTLLEWGMFEKPPDVVEHEDGTWQVPPWIPGRYLTLLAPMVPEVVTEIFKRIPPTNRNPSVWRVVAKSGLVLPPTWTPEVAELLRRAIQTSSSAVFVRDLLPFVTHMAQLRTPEAFQLLEVMLLIEKPASPRFPNHWLRSLDEYHLDQILEHVIPLLRAADPWRTQELLVKKLARLAKMADLKHSVYPGSSRNWCRRIGRTDVHDEAPVKFAKACVDNGLAIATDQETASRVCEAFKTENHELFVRLYIRFIADAGSLASEHVDQFLTSDYAIEPPFGIAEVAFALRQSFLFGSPSARRLFVHEIERGPGLDVTAWEWRHSKETKIEVSPLTISKAAEAWQRERLTWFQDQLPVDLAPLAARIGHLPRKLSAHDEGLAYDGFYVSSGPSIWETDTSPNTVEELRGMENVELVRHLKTWAPDPAPVLPGYSSARELGTTFRTLVTESPDRIEGLIDASLTLELPPPYVQALLEGVDKLVDAVGSSLPWGPIVSMVDAAIAKGLAADDDSTKKEWSWAAREGLRCLRHAARANILPAELSNAVWDMLRNATLAGAELDHKEPVTSTEALVASASSEVSGGTIDALVEFALTIVRQRPPGSPTPLLARTADDLAPYDDLLLEIETNGTINAQATLGQLLPWVLPHAPTWAAKFAERLAAQARLNEPIHSPIWGVYILRCHFYRTAFDTMRLVYSAASKQVTPTSELARREWSYDKHLTEHIVAAVLHGCIGVADSEGLLATVFGKVTVADRSDSYWLVWRSLEDTPASYLPELTPRVLSFWDWRLSCLENLTEGSDPATEAKALTWLLLAKQLPTAESLPLAVRTLRLSHGELAIDMHFWDRATAFALADSAGANDLIELAIGAELKSPLADITLKEARPALEVVLRSEDRAAVSRAVKLVHRLGDQGFDEFGDLL